MLNTSNNSRIYASEYGYDRNNNVNKIGVIAGNTGVSMTYTYGKDNLPSAYTAGTNSGAYTYDYLNRLKSKTSSITPTVSYNYTSGTAMVSQELCDGVTITYFYDKNGNISSKKEGSNRSFYTYDEFNRLTIEQNEALNQTITYKYDAWGNIAMKKVYRDTDTLTPPSSKLIKSYDYVYSSSTEGMKWKDLMTEYDGKTITYDAIGNPLTYDGKTFTWLGRRLSTYNNGSTSTSYKYNADGIRTSKTVGSTKTEYFLNGSQIIAQKTGSNVIPFYYDANGTRIAFKYNGTMYYYVYNLQGDVTHIIDASKNIVDTYQYDAWGKILNLGALSEVGNANPFRYRGYYYDNESGLYYLNSRYYNAEWGRFINADGYVSTGQGITGYNMFAYCNNNPINNVDPTGNCPYNGSMGDFRRLEMGLPSMDCTCGIVSLATGLSYINELFSFGTDSALDLAEYANNTGARPNNIGVGTFNKQVIATKNSLQSISKGLSKVFNGISAVLIVYGAVENAKVSRSAGESDDIIKWDITIDVVYGLTGVAASYAASTAVGAFVGNLCPIPVVGSALGAVAGYAVGLGIDWISKEVKLLYRKRE